MLMHTPCQTDNVLDINNERLKGCKIMMMDVYSNFTSCCPLDCASFEEKYELNELIWCMKETAN